MMFRYELAKRRDKILMWIAWRLPRRFIMWCYIRVAAHATTGEHANTLVCELGMMDALGRWEVK